MPTLRVQSPLRGVNTVVNREGQTPDTCWSATNMLPYDRFGRRRVAQRSGLAKEWTTQLGSTQIQGMLPVNNITYSATSTSVQTVSTVISTFTNIPSGVTTTGNSITWPTNSTGYTPALSDIGPSWTGTVPSTAFTLSFDATLAGSSTGGASFLWATFNTTPHTFQNIFTSTRLSASYTIDPTNLSGDVEIQGRSNNGGGTGTKNLWLTNSPPTNPPIVGVPFHSDIVWSSTGSVLPDISSTTNQFSPPDTLSVPLGNNNSTLNFFAELPNSTGLTISNIVLTQSSTVTSSTGSIGYQTLLVAVCQGFVWIGRSDGTMVKAANGQSTALINSTNIVSMAYCQGVVFITDGVRLVTYTVATDTVAVATAVPSPGNITGTVPPNCSLICNWRGRIVLAGDSNNPQNYYMSRVPGTYFNTVTSTNVAIGPGADWDFSQNDGAAAFAGNNNTGLQIGEPIVALMPFSNDYLKMGCSHSLWMYQGDPAVNGNLVNVSQDIGIVGKDAWCVDPAGTMWFVATGGLYHVRPAWELYRPPEPVSLQSVNQAFRNLSPGQQRIVLVYDPDLHYLHIFGSPVFQGDATHLTMDARSMSADGPPGFWPQKFPNAQNPVCACTYFADGNPNNRAILLGGFDGYIRDWTDSAIDDDGTAISAGVTLGPFAPIPGEAAILNGTTIDMGEVPAGFSSTTWNVNVIIAAGPDAYSVTEGLNVSANPHPIPTVNGLTLDRRQKTFRQRVRGGWFTISLQNLTNNTLFSFESAALDFVPAGHNRMRR